MALKNDFYWSKFVQLHACLWNNESMTVTCMCNGMRNVWGMACREWHANGVLNLSGMACWTSAECHACGMANFEIFFNPNLDPNQPCADNLVPSSIGHLCTFWRCSGGGSPMDWVYRKRRYTPYIDSKKTNKILQPEIQFWITHRLLLYQYPFTYP